MWGKKICTEKCNTMSVRKFHLWFRASYEFKPILTSTPSFYKTSKLTKNSKGQVSFHPSIFLKGLHNYNFLSFSHPSWTVYKRMVWWQKEPSKYNFSGPHKSDKISGSHRIPAFCVLLLSLSIILYTQRRNINCCWTSVHTDCTTQNALLPSIWFQKHHESTLFQERGHRQLLVLGTEVGCVLCFGHYAGTK